MATFYRHRQSARRTAKQSTRRETTMKEKEKDTVVSQSKTQSNCYLANPRDFIVVAASVPFHGQHGDTEGQYRGLLKQSEAANASNFTQAMEVHPNVDRATKPHTP
jgi:hypothetical protein